MTPNEYLYSKIKELDDKFDNSFFMAEVGSDAGTTAIWTLRAMKENRSKRWFFSIDPYGDKPYNINGNDFTGFEYGDQKYRKTLEATSKYAQEFELNHCHWKLRSQDFMNVFPQVEFWTQGEKYKDPQFCWAYLDGEHAWNPVEQEFKWFYDRMPVGGVICIDDINLFGETTDFAGRLPYAGNWEFKDDDCYRAYFTKCESQP